MTNASKGSGLRPIESECLLRRARIVSLLFFVALFAFADVRAQEPRTDLTELKLEDLMNIKVTSVSRREQRLFQSAAAVYVITQDDIRHSGATSVPDLLRMVPGLEVARISASQWAISSRGFNSQYAGKMLVLIDGRSVYAPSFSGVYWDVQNLVLEDIDRIEVIRGPGASVWGANAVNGVINIITKPAQETQGGLLVAGSGTEELGFGTVRYGGKAGKNTYYRAYATYFNRDDLVDQSGQPFGDNWDLLQGGFRVDRESGSDSLTVQGEIYYGDAGQHQFIGSLMPPFFDAPLTRRELSGGHLLSRWSRTFSNDSQTTLQVYFDKYRRDEATLDLRQETLEIDFQHRFIAGVHDVVWGGAYRLNHNDLFGSFTVSTQPPHVRAELFSAFAQDEIALIRNRFRLILGSKIEHNHYTGFEIQPTIRAVWTPHSNHTVWGAVSRAVRMPFDLETSAHVIAAVYPGNNGIPAVLRIEGIGLTNARSEVLYATEAGYRASLTRTFYVDVAGFYNNYDKVMSAEPETPFFEIDPRPHLVIPLRLDHDGRATTYGVETLANWQVTGRWNLSAGQSWLRFYQELGKLGQNGLTLPVPDGSPRHQYQMASNLNLPRSIEIDASLKYVGRLKSPDTPSYTRLDVRAGWQAAERLNLSFVGQNLLQGRRIEFGNTETNLASWSRRGFYGKVTWQF